MAGKLPRGVGAEGHFPGDAVGVPTAPTAQPGSIRERVGVSERMWLTKQLVGERRAVDWRKERTLHAGTART